MNPPSLHNDLILDSKLRSPLRRHALVEAGGFAGLWGFDRNLPEDDQVPAL